MQMKSLVCVSLIGLAGACSDDSPPTPSAVRAEIAADLPNVLRESKAAWDGTDASIPALPGGASTAVAMAKLRFPKLAAALTPQNPQRARPTDPADTGDAFDPDAAATWLNEHVFTDANE